ncbi:MAG: hypothetical protein DRQ55_09850 [Planctomycetota bacterium]|nr:MAG: hypothetical protein DRQ55_09850 [Planctomycetota bacterium]
MHKLLLVLAALAPLAAQQLLFRAAPAPNEIVLATGAPGTPSHRLGQALSRSWDQALLITTHVAPAGGDVPAAQLLTLELADLALAPRDAELPEGVSLLAELRYEDVAPASSASASAGDGDGDGDGDSEDPVVGIDPGTAPETQPGTGADTSTASSSTTRLLAATALHPGLVERLVRSLSAAPGSQTWRVVHADQHATERPSPPAPGDALATPAPPRHVGALAARQPAPTGAAALVRFMSRHGGACASAVLLALLITRRGRRRRPA